MSIINAYYKFKLIPFKSKDKYTLHRIYKWQNDPYFNKLFANIGEVSFKSLEPSGLTTDSIFYPLQFVDADKTQQMLLFETALFLYPYGIVNVGKSNDCYLFRVSDSHVYEVMVSKGTLNQLTQILTLMVDGALNEEIDQILTHFSTHEITSK